MICLSHRPDLEERTLLSAYAKYKELEPEQEEAMLNLFDLHIAAGVHIAVAAHRTMSEFPNKAVNQLNDWINFRAGIQTCFDRFTSLFIGDTEMEMEVEELDVMETFSKFMGFGNSTIEALIESVSQGMDAIAALQLHTNWQAQPMLEKYKAFRSGYSRRLCLDPLGEQGGKHYEQTKL